MLKYFYYYDKAIAMSIEISVNKVPKYRFNNKVIQWISYCSLALNLNFYLF